MPLVLVLLGRAGLIAFHPLPSNYHWGWGGEGVVAEGGGEGVVAEGGGEG